MENYELLLEVMTNQSIHIGRITRQSDGYVMVSLQDIPESTYTSTSLFRALVYVVLSALYNRTTQIDRYVDIPNIREDAKVRFQRKLDALWEDIKKVEALSEPAKS